MVNNFDCKDNAYALNANKKTVKILVLIQKLVSLRAYLSHIFYMQYFFVIELIEIKIKN